MELKAEGVTDLSDRQLLLPPGSLSQISGHLRRHTSMLIGTKLMRACLADSQFSLLPVILMTSWAPQSPLPLTTSSPLVPFSLARSGILIWTSKSEQIFWTLDPRVPMMVLWCTWSIMHSIVTWFSRSLTISRMRLRAPSTQFFAPLRVTWSGMKVVNKAEEKKDFWN